MRASMIAGIVLIAIGGFLFYNGGSFTTRRDVVKVGDMKITADEQHPVAPWVAGVAVVSGIALIVAGARSRA